MGLSIGSHGANIAAARAIPGIESIYLDESHSESGQCTFKIQAKNAEAAEQARNLLEFVVDSFPISRDLVGKIIGKSGKTIQEIVSQFRRYVVIVIVDF
jgi:fragile X mental retardation protein